jgi:hypothetical protein
MSLKIQLQIEFYLRMRNQLNSIQGYGSNLNVDYTMCKLTTNDNHIGLQLDNININRMIQVTRHMNRYKTQNHYSGIKLVSY